MKMNNSNLLRKKLKEPGIILSPGVYDCISAKIAERTGFEVIFTPLLVQSCRLNRNVLVQATSLHQQRVHIREISERNDRKLYLISTF
jgi:2-methylisocitrate lyase-like PEP mutase family enzyme